MPHIFITGATGYIGRVVTELAIAEGHTVRGLSRTEEGDALLRKLGATPVRGDLTTLDVLSRESAAADIVLHLAFIHDFSGKTPFDTILEVDAAAVGALAEPLQSTDKPLIITSGTALVQPDPNGGETDENAPPAKLVLVPRIKSENSALAWKDKGVRIAVIRLPPYVYGRSAETGFAALQIKLALEAGEAAYVDDGSHHTSDVYVDDAARLYLLIAQETKPGEIWNGAAHTTVTHRDLATAIGALLKVPVKSIPFEEAEKRWGPFLPRFTSLENRASSKKAIERLGWNPQGVDLLTDIQHGGYVAVAEKLKSGQK